MVKTFLVSYFIVSTPFVSTRSTNGLIYCSLVLYKVSNNSDIATLNKTITNLNEARIEHILSYVFFESISLIKLACTNQVVFLCVFSKYVVQLDGKRGAEP